MAGSGIRAGVTFDQHYSFTPRVLQLINALWALVDLSFVERMTASHTVRVRFSDGSYKYRGMKALDAAVKTCHSGGGKVRAEAHPIGCVVR